ncbi:peptidase family M1-domain-containing protein [Ilyonectria destructans]|nr:peptidase family M1-domain-containing protein [Ilyonectria destructans]
MASQPQYDDIHTRSNFKEVVTEHTVVTLAINFDQQIIAGSTALTLKSRCVEDLNQVVLDTSYLNITRVAINGNPTEWELKPRSEPNGSPLHIYLQNPARYEEVIKLNVDFETTSETTGLQWFSPEQTDDGKYPFVFSQCEPVHARSIFPCQDTPSVKSTFNIHVHSIFPVVASGCPAQDPIYHAVEGTPESKIYTFIQDIPISNYLFSVASGNFVSAQISPRSYIYCTPGHLDACKAELQPDLEGIIQAAEELLFEYPWPLYNLVVLPKSFHLGGMENPIFNFYSATVISGDRQNVHVVAHEFAHSFSGNLVTNASWEHFWLNEGWTVFIERYIIRKLRGEDEETFQALVGWQELLYAIESYGGNESKFTSLVMQFDGQRPDDVMSKISYEKGYTFLCYLEKTVGREKWLVFARHYFKSFSRKAVDSEAFTKCLQDFFEADDEASKALASVDWHMWLHEPGAPPTPNFKSKLYDHCIQLTAKWQSLSAVSAFQPSAADVDGWIVGQQLVFLDQLIAGSDPIPQAYVESLGSTYGLRHSKNLEVLSRYLRVALRAGDRDSLQLTANVLGETGRMKFVRPLFEELIDLDKKYAIQIFNKYKNFYHPTCGRLIMNVFQGRGIQT